MICVIPFRKGSKRIPNKNMKLLNGMELYKYTVYQALESKSFSKIIIATDYAKEFFMEFINKYPEIDFYARDEVSDEQSANRYINEIISRYSLSFEKNICLLQVTCPLRLVLDIRTATDTYKFGYGDTLNGLLSVTKTKPSNKMYTLDEYKISPYCSKVVDLYYRNSSIYIFNVGSFLYFNGLDCIYNEPNVGSYIMPAERSIDIDTMEDFNLAEMLIRGGVLDVANHA